MFFTIFQNEKTHFQAIKTASSKSRKIAFSSKGVNPWFWSKNGHFSNFFFQPIWARKMSFTLLQNEKTYLQAIKTRSSKIQKIDIFPKLLVHGFGAKLAIFPSLFFQAIQPRKMCFMIFLSEKTHFQTIKTRSSQRRKIDIFPKGLTYCFGPKMVILPTYFLVNKVQENAFYVILERKNAFLGYKNKKFKKSKN